MEQSSEPATDPANPGNFVMTDEQWNFIYKYYPEYGSGPYDLMVWLFNEAAKSENVDSAYGKPGVIGGRGVVGDDDKEEEEFVQMVSFCQRKDFASFFLWPVLRLMPGAVHVLELHVVCRLPLLLRRPRISHVTMHHTD